jgi:hypothetical protein
MPLPICELLSLSDAASPFQIPRWDQICSGLSPSNIPVGASPFTYQNPITGPANVLISGGTVTSISYSRDGSTFFLVGLLAGQVHLSTGDFVRIVYVLAPTMTLIPF